MKKITFLLVLIAIVIAHQPNANAQSKKDLRKHKEQQIEIAIQELLQQGEFRFVAQKASTALPDIPAQGITGYSDIKITSDLIQCNLPFWGTTHSALIKGGDSPLKFKSTKFTITSKTIQKKRGTTYTMQIEAIPDDGTALAILNLIISPGGSTVLIVNKLNLSPITFYGVIAPLEAN